MILLPAAHKNVYAADELPQKVNLPASLIINTDNSYNEGRHWLAIYIDSNEVAEYFDSFGIPPNNNNFIKFIRRNSRSWSFNDIGLQSYFSNVCGKYCLCYLYFKSQNYTLKDFIGKFSRNRDKNDEIVTAMHQKLFVDNFNEPLSLYNLHSFARVRNQISYPYEKSVEGSKVFQHNSNSKL